MRRRDRQKFGGLPVARSAAGAGRFLRGGRNRLDVPEARGPRNAVTVRLNTISLTDLDLAIQVCAVKPRSLGPKIVLDRVGRPRGVDAVLVPGVFAAALYGFLTADNYGLRVGIPLRHRSGAGAEPKKGDENNDEEEYETLPQFRVVAVAHDEPFSSSRRNACVFL